MVGELYKTVESDVSRTKIGEKNHFPAWWIIFLNHLRLSGWQPIRSGSSWKQTLSWSWRNHSRHVSFCRPIVYCCLENVVGFRRKDKQNKRHIQWQHKKRRKINYWRSGKKWPDRFCRSPSRKQQQFIVKEKRKTHIEIKDLSDLKKTKQVKFAIL